MAAPDPERAAILTDEKGRPFQRPQRADFADVTSYLRAVWAFHDAIANESSAAFAGAFRRAVRS